jgi:hypothetical protein
VGRFCAQGLALRLDKALVAAKAPASTPARSLIVRAQFRIPNWQVLQEQLVGGPTEAENA